MNLLLYEVAANFLYVWFFCERSDSKWCEVPHDYRNITWLDVYVWYTSIVKHTPAKWLHNKLQPLNGTPRLHWNVTRFLFLTLPGDQGFSKNYTIPGGRTMCVMTSGPIRITKSIQLNGLLAERIILYPGVCLTYRKTQWAASKCGVQGFFINWLGMWTS